MVSVHGPAVSAIYFGVGGYLLVTAALYMSNGVNLPTQIYNRVIMIEGLGPAIQQLFQPFESCSDIPDNLPAPALGGFSLADFQLACSTSRLGYILAGVLSLIGGIVSVVGSIVHATAKDQARAFKGFVAFIISGAFFLLGESVINIGNANRMGKCRSAAELPFSNSPLLNSDSTECTRYVLSATILFFGTVGLLACGGLAFSPKRSNSFAIAGGAFGLGCFLLFTAVVAFYEADGFDSPPESLVPDFVKDNFQSSLYAQGASAAIAGLVCVVGAIFEGIKGMKGTGKRLFAGSFSEMTPTATNPSIKV